MQDINLGFLIFVPRVSEGKVNKLITAQSRRCPSVGRENLSKP